MFVPASTHTSARDDNTPDTPNDSDPFAGTRRVVEQHLARAVLAAQHRADRTALGPLPDVTTTHPSPFRGRTPDEMGRDDGEARRARHAVRVAALVRAARPARAGQTRAGDDDAAGCGTLRA
jgi:hypothetical protein